MKPMAAVSQAGACLNSTLSQLPERRAPREAHLAFSFVTLTLHARPSAWLLLRLLSELHFSGVAQFERGVFGSELESAGSEV